MQCAKHNTNFFAQRTKPLITNLVQLATFPLVRIVTFTEPSTSSPADFESGRRKVRTTQRTTPANGRGSDLVGVRKVPQKIYRLPRRVRVKTCGKSARAVLGNQRLGKPRGLQYQAWPSSACAAVWVRVGRWSRLATSGLDK